MKALIWDFDETLAHRSGGRWTDTFCTLLSERLPDVEVRRSAISAQLQSGLPWHEWERHHRHLRSSAEWWTAIRPLLVRAFVAGGASGLIAEELADAFPKTYCDLRYWQVYPDTMPTLEALSRVGWRHIILSNHVFELPEIVAGLGLAHHFHAVFSSAIIGVEKPNHEAYQTVLSAIGEVEDLWMIGDSITADVIGPERFGWKAILVRKADPRARFRADNLIEVIDILKQPKQALPRAPMARSKI